jgi:outer membrane beta-barrel protein
VRFLFVFCLVALPVYAQEELENPGSVSAIQERAYKMGSEVDLAVGSLPADAFYKGFYAQLGYTFHFTDSFAWQVGRGAYSYNVKTGLREQLERDFGVLPTVFDEVQYFVGSDLMLKPFYGKTSVFNKYVIHVEGHLQVGGSAFKFSVGGFAPAVSLGGGLRLFISQNVSFRLDVVDHVVIFLSKRPINLIGIHLNLALNFGGGD